MKINTVKTNFQANKDNQDSTEKEWEVGPIVAHGGKELFYNEDNDVAQVIQDCSNEDNAANHISGAMSGQGVVMASSSQELRKKSQSGAIADQRTRNVATTQGARTGNSSSNNVASFGNYEENNQYGGNYHNGMPGPSGGEINNRRMQTAPASKLRGVLGGTQTTQKECDAEDNEALLIPLSYKENDLLRAANIYQKFDKKGNIYENRLYAQTSINQHKLEAEQKKYDKKMEQQPDEWARINQGTLNSGLSNIGKSQSSLIDPGTRGNPDMMSATSQIKSAYSMSNLNYLNKSQTTTNIMKQYTQQKLKGTISFGKDKFMNTRFSRGTFARANQPRISDAQTSLNQYRQNKTLLDKITEQNRQLNKDTRMSEFTKSSQNVSLRNVQKSFAKLQCLNKSTNLWSLRDQNLQTVTSGIGGAQQTFKKSSNLFTNDPLLFREKEYVETHRSGTIQSNNLHAFSSHQNYCYKGVDDKDQSKTKPMTANLTDRNQIFTCGKVINADSHNFYKQQVNKKGSSNVVIADKDPAGYTTFNKIQKKAYRANTQSIQKDGLYKPDKFNKKHSLLNHSRVTFNIINPYQVDHGVGGPNATDVASLFYVQEKNPKTSLETIRKGKCHQMYGISDFTQTGHLSGIKYHDRYQEAYTKNDQLFKRRNGEFTQHTDTMKLCKF